MVSQTPGRGKITQSTVFDVFVKGSHLVSPHPTLVRSNRLEGNFRADRTEVGRNEVMTLIRNGFRVGLRALKSHGPRAPGSVPRSCPGQPRSSSTWALIRRALDQAGGPAA